MGQSEGNPAEPQVIDSSLSSIVVATAPREELWVPGRGPTLSRRLFLTLGAAAACGVVNRALGKYIEVSQAQQTFNEWLDAVLADYPDNAQMSAIAEACGPTFIDLDYEQHLAGIEGRLDIDEYLFGTSNVFGNGFDGSHNPYKQPNSLGQIGFEAIDDEAKTVLRLGELQSLTFAKPGSYSGNSNYPGTGVGADDCLLGEGQMRHSEFQRRLRQSEALQLVRIEGGYDDYRLMFTTMNQLAGRLTDILHLAGGGSINDDVRKGLDEFIAAVRHIAREFGDHIVESAGLLQDANDERLRNGLSRIVAEYVFTWALDGQGRFPYGPLQKGTAPGVLGRFAHPDQTGPADLDRQYLDLDALPGGIGRKLARIAWAEIFLAQASALHRITKRYPQLHYTVENLTDINRRPNFYAARVPYGDPNGAIDAQGGGHPGMSTGLVAGIQHLAEHNLSHKRRESVGKGVTLGTYGGKVLLSAS